MWYYVLISTKLYISRACGRALQRLKQQNYKSIIPTLYKSRKRALFFIYTNWSVPCSLGWSMYIYRRTILTLNRKITARQIKHFKVFYSSFFSLTSDSLQTTDLWFFSNVLLLSKVGSLWFLSLQGPPFFDAKSCLPLKMAQGTVN
jgi:hypothetical protein